MSRSPARMNPKSASRSIPELVLIALIALVPVVFERLTQECFEIPQAALLATGALVLLGYALAREAGRASSWATRLKAWAARDLLGVGILLFLLSAVLSTLASPNPAQSLHGAPDSTAGLVAALSTAAVYFASRSVSRGDPRVLLRFARAAGCASAIASGYALLQLTGLDPLIWGRTASYDGAVRIFGTLGHPNMLGAYLAMTMPLTIWLAVRAGSGAERSLWALIATVSVVTIAATLSRGAWIGLGAGAMAVALLAWIGKGRPAGKTSTPRRSRLPMALLVSLAAALVAVLFFARTPMGPHVLDRVRQLTSLSAPTTQSRLHIWRAAWRMFQDHPAWGVGLDAFGTFFPRYRTAEYWRVEWGRTPNKAHNEALQILATQGLVGGIAALLVLALALRAIVSAARRGEGDARWGAIVAGAALVAFAVQDLASFTVVALGSLAAAIAGWVSSA
ncbi:MAG TPA: O-antigen ligase family protein, partial [Candidatus Saccharimonadales bacterium]|nr:O-antigen ligase family protein [Candidatus Saccharimonadales bacterium]